MRVNHVGEVCPQALYQGQALTARNPEHRSALERAARAAIPVIVLGEFRSEFQGPGTARITKPGWIGPPERAGSERP